MPGIHRLATLKQPNGSTKVRSIPKGEGGKEGENAFYEIVLPSVIDLTISGIPVKDHPLYNAPNNLLEEILKRK